MTFNIAQEFFITITNRLLKHNKNWICVICGGTGSGKSYAGLKLADILSANTFNVDYSLAFSPKQFMENIISGKLHKGDILLFDEAGVGLSSKDWYTLQNKLLNNVLQTFRHKNIGLIFTTPSLSFMDKTARILTHTYMETRKIDRQVNLCYLKVYKFEHNSMLDKTYKKHYAFYDDKNKLTYMPELALGLPSEELIKAYEKKKDQYTSKLNKETLAELNNDDSKKKEVLIGRCPKCNNRSYYYKKLTQTWQCKRCGQILHKNPYSEI